MSFTIYPAIDLRGASGAVEGGRPGAHEHL